MPPEPADREANVLQGVVHHVGESHVLLSLFGGVVQHGAYFIEAAAETMERLDAGLGRGHPAGDEVLDA